LLLVAVIVAVVAKVFIVILFTEVTRWSVTETCPLNGNLNIFFKRFPNKKRLG